MNSSTLIYHGGLPHLSLKYAQKCCVFDNKKVENLSHFSFKHSILVSFLLRLYNCILTERTDWCVCERACACVHVCGLFLIYLHSNPLGSSCNPCRQRKIRESDWLFFPRHRRESDFSSTASFSGHCTNCS